MARGSSPTAPLTEISRKGQVCYRPESIRWTLPQLPPTSIPKPNTPATNPKTQTPVRATLLILAVGVLLMMPCRGGPSVPPAG